MVTVTIPDLSDEIHRALKHRGLINGTSVEIEVNAILEKTVLLENRVKIGTELAAFARKFGGLDLDTTRDPTATESANFE
jgi:plasmid stability protein